MPEGSPCGCQPLSGGHSQRQVGGWGNLPQTAPSPTSSLPLPEAYRAWSHGLPMRMLSLTLPVRSQACWGT